MAIIKKQVSVTLFDVKNKVEVQMKDSIAPVGELYVSKKKKAHDNLDYLTSYPNGVFVLEQANSSVNI